MTTVALESITNKIFRDNVATIRLNKQNYLSLVFFLLK